ncbi:flavin reductase family protein [Mesobacillus harenae]|uniref:flavin reductase family protein n=1 Tax=Mesobacillus harenae TaxID=2213203 RepID=UPI00158056B6|nr:flavin reductase family protein [Mesobacillus harenae]
MSFDSREFRNAIGCFSTGITVITVKGEGDTHAMTANAVSSVSLSPPVVLICIDHRAKCLNLIHEAGFFGVNILKDSQIDISRHFANQKCEDDPQFKFITTEEGAPLLENALVNLNCKVIQSVVVGDHTVFFGEVLNLNTEDGTPLCFYKGQYRQLA